MYLFLMFSNIMYLIAGYYLLKMNVYHTLINWLVVILLSAYIVYFGVFKMNQCIIFVLIVLMLLTICVEAIYELDFIGSTVAVYLIAGILLTAAEAYRFVAIWLLIEEYLVEKQIWYTTKIPSTVKLNFVVNNWYRECGVIGNSSDIDICDDIKQLIHRFFVDDD